MVVPEILAPDQDEELGLFQRPFDQQLTLADMGLIGGVDGVDAPFILVECLMPSVVVGILDGFGRVTDVQSVAVGIVGSVPQRADLRIAQPIADTGHIFAGNV